MTVWMVRGGRLGEFQESALTEGYAVISFGFKKDLADFTDREQLLNSLRSEPAHRDSSNKSVGNAASQLWNFAKEIHNGDMVIMPLKGTSRVISVGEVTGDYQFHPDADVGYHTRNINWIAADIPREAFDQDLLFSLGSSLTVSQPRAENAAKRIEEIVKKHLSGEPITESESDVIHISDDSTPEIDLDEQIEDQIVRRIRQKFSGTRLEYLVAKILEASDYTVMQTRQGPDGGIDVLAGTGDMGFGNPKLCVQVKSGRTPIKLPDYDRLQGNIQSFGAEYGLLVSLSDFTIDVRKENERSFFKIRLWGPRELVGRLLETYESLPPEIRADIPLQNRRVLVESED